MATITAQPGVTTSFSGGADDLVCTFSSLSRAGAVIQCTGFTLDQCTVQAKTTVGSYDTITTTAVYSAVVGQGFQLSSIRLSGLAGGTYSVNISN